MQNRSVSTPCVTREFFASVPADLITWSEAEAAVGHSPYPMSARNLRRLYKAGERPVYRVPGLRGERVSRSLLMEFHRDLAHGWLTRRQSA